MKRLVVLTICLLVMASTAFGDGGVPPYVPVSPGMDRPASGSIGAVGQFVEVGTSGMSTCHITITGTSSLTATVKTLGADLGTWSVINPSQIVGGVAQSPVTSITANGDYEVKCGGVVAVEVICTAYTSGSAAVSLRASMGSGYLGGGGSSSGGGGSLTNYAEETGGNLANVATSTATTATNTSTIATNTGSTATNTSGIDTDLKSGAEKSQVSDGSGNAATVDATAPAGSERGLTVRTIPRKRGAVLTTSTLTAASVYTQPWTDTNTDGVVYVTVQVTADQSSSTNGFAIQGSNDTAVSGFTTNIYQATVTGGTPATVTVCVPYEFFRIVYTNGSTNQGSFEIASTSSQVPPAGVPIFDTNGYLRTIDMGKKAGEDPTNDVQGIIPKSIVAATYAPNGTYQSAVSGSQIASGVVSAAATILTRLSAGNGDAAVRYLWLTNATSAPAGSLASSSASVVHIYSVWPSTTLTLDFGSAGLWFSAGEAWGMSTSATSFTAATASETTFNADYYH